MVHDTLIPNILEGITNGTTKAVLLKNDGMITLYQETVEECIIKLVFKYYYDVNNNYVGGHEK